MAEEESNNNFVKIMGLALIVIIVAAGTSYFILNYQSIMGKADATEEDNKDIGPTYELGDFVVNLSGAGSHKYVKASIVAEISQDDLQQELEKRNPQVRDIIISILRQQNLEELQDPEASVIKNQIINKLNQIFTKGKITNVWFTELVIQ